MNWLGQGKLWRNKGTYCKSINKIINKIQNMSIVQSIKSYLIKLIRIARRDLNENNLRK